MDDKTLDEQVADLFRDLPSDEATRAAGRAIAALVRYLNHATHNAEALQYPSTVDSLLGSLGGAMAGLDQLLDQTGHRLALLAQHPGAYSTANDGKRPAERSAAWAVMHLADARTRLDTVARLLGSAQTHAGHIGINTEED